MNKLTVSEIVQLAECSQQFHLDRALGARRSDHLKARAVQGNNAHLVYEWQLRSSPVPEHTPRASWLSTVLQFLRRIIHLIFGQGNP